MSEPRRDLARMRGGRGAQERARWWHSKPDERFWLEATDRSDIGANLKAPLRDATGRETWRYCLFREASVGDVVYHYDSTRRALVASSIICGPATPKRIEWVARGSYAKNRRAALEEVDGYEIPLTRTQWLGEPLLLDELRAAKDQLLGIEAACIRDWSGPLYFPFELSKRPVRPLQGYAFKLPAGFVAAFPKIYRASSDPVPSAPWTDEELSMCVQEYVHLLDRQERQDHPNYADAVRQLAAKIGRGVGAVDRRMQTITSVLRDRGARHVYRFPPAQTLTPGIEKRLRNLLRYRIPTGDPAELDELTRKARTSGVIDVEPSGTLDPAPTETYSAKRYKRRADVKAWVLETADGTCEACGALAPFVGMDGLPFLEVHHLRPLAERGPDTICNAAAVCPNCHRRLHLSEDKFAFRDGVIRRVKRLRDHSQT